MEKTLNWKQNNFEKNPENENEKFWKIVKIKKVLKNPKNHKIFVKKQ